VPRLIVLDALGLAYRAHYAFIRRPLVTAAGEPTSAIFGFANMALRIRREERPDRWALAWDGPGLTFRHERFPDYKATRKPMPDELLAQIPVIEEVAQALGLPVIEIPGCEADDVMATLAVQGARAGWDVTLVTSDKDLLQLVNDRVTVLAPAGRGEEHVRMDRAAVHARWGVAPEQIGDVLALMGDASDNVPGVKGVGEKTAVELISTFGSLDALYERLAEVPRPALREKLAAHRAMAYLSRELVTVRTDLALPVGLEDLRVAPVRRDDLVALARRWQLQRLERIAHELGVDEAEAGSRVHARSAERRGTAAETQAAGVRLAGAPAPRPPAAPPASDEGEAGGGAGGGGRAGRDAPPATGPARAHGPEAAEARPVSDAGAAPAGDVAPASVAPAVRALRRAAFAPRPGEQGTLDLFGARPPEGLAGGGEAGEDLGAPEVIARRLHAVRARSVHGLALLPVFDGHDPRTSTLAGLALAALDGTACYLPLDHVAGANVSRDAVRAWLGPAMADAATPKLAHDLKAALHALARLDVPLEGLDLDLHLASFVCDPERDHGLDALARDVLGVALPPVEPPAGRGRPRPAITSRPPGEIAPAAMARAAAIPPLAEALRAQVEAREQGRLYATLELPLVPVLWAMERAGVRLDAAVLEGMAARAAEDLARLEGELQALAGGPLNLHSGAQLARVMFETLGLKAGRRTKTGFSTDQATLEALAAQHPFPRLLLEWRALAKLKSTYLDALPAARDPADGRVHTTFEQAGAATGRLSSSAPNLQNIPMRTPQGRAIRRAFVAPEGGVLVGADYSQIELRVMAHLSGDAALIEAFAAGEDVHASTARRVFGVTGALDPALRARAKIVNFGVMYGMGARSLSAQMGIPLEEAQDFIAHYFRVYAGVREFLDRTVAEARRRGYVETLLGRRRWLPGLAATHGGERALAERAAINTPIQGSAADLVRLAMVRVHRALKAFPPSARLLLQVHDELLLECAANDADAVSAVVRAEMEGCLALRVPLVVTVGRGPTWFDVH